MTKFQKFNPLKCECFRWSTYITLVFYLCFILFTLNISFPLKSDHFHSTKYSNKNNNNEQNGDSEVNNLNAEYANRLRLKKDDLLHRKEIETIILSNQNTESTKLLKLAFKKADLNHDHFLSIQELAKYINAKVRDHIDTSIRNNPILFSQVDLDPKDGLITWEEYHEYFLRERGLDETYIKDHSEKNHKLDRKSKELLMKDKALWAEASRSDPFGLTLTLDEFLAFRHPESSASYLLNLVDDLLKQFDDDGDDHLTIDEFSKIVTDDLGEGRKLILSKKIDEQKLEFRRLIDRNNDKKADRSELLSYIDPRHPRHALQEAATLFSLADKNKDLRLTIDEILVDPKIFLQSKMIDAEESFHDEF